MFNRYLVLASLLVFAALAASTAEASDCYGDKERNLAHDLFTGYSYPILTAAIDGARNGPLIIRGLVCDKDETLDQKDDVNTLIKLDWHLLYTAAVKSGLDPGKVFVALIDLRDEDAANAASAKN